MNASRDITPMLVFAIFSAVLGMFQFGFNTGVINAPQKVLEEFIANVYKSRTGEWISEELRDLIWSITVSIFAIGGMIGGLLAPTVANWCGRKTGLVLNNTVAIIGVTLMSSSQLSQSIECLIIGRFFIGLNCGLNTALVPMYLTEISTVNLRGALGTVSQLGVTVGLLFSQVLGLKEILGTKDYWPFLFGFAFVPAVLQLIMLPFCPESPRYLLLSCGRVSEARLALRRLRASSDVESDIEEMKAEDLAHQEEVRKFGRLSSVRELFNHPWLRTPLIIGIMMQLSQQLSGINAIFYYSTDIFLSAELPEDYAVYATMGVGFIMVIMTLISIPLMDRLGRRTLHLYGLGGMFLASIFLTISLLVKFLYEWMKYISVISILLFTVFFGIGPGSIPFMITAELFTQGTRPAAMSVSVLFNWFSNFCVGLAFPIMKRLLQSYLFLPFTVFLAIFWIFTYKKLPETKNRTFEEIAALFRPIQYAPSGSGPGFPDYGCNITGNLDMPGAPENNAMMFNGQGAVSTDQTIVGGGGGADISLSKTSQRFRSDSTGTGAGSFRQSSNINQAQNNLDHVQEDFVHGHGHQALNHNNSLSQGNLYKQMQQHQHHHNSHSFIPHTSCTSIQTQNLSTNDQQPLIVEGQSDRFHAHHHHVHDYHHHHHSTSNDFADDHRMTHQQPQRQQQHVHQHHDAHSHSQPHTHTQTHSLHNHQHQHNQHLHNDNDASESYHCSAHSHSKNISALSSCPHTTSHIPAAPHKQSLTQSTLNCCNHLETTTTSFMGHNTNNTLNNRRISTTTTTTAAAAAAAARLLSYQDDTEGLDDDVDDDDCAFCCDSNNVKFSGPGGVRLSHEYPQALRRSSQLSDAVQDASRMKSRTLTRTFKPLNDMQYPAAAHATVDDSSLTELMKRKSFI